MSISLIIFLYIYYGFLVIWGFLFLALVYHMFKFGFKNFPTFLYTFIFIIVAILMLNASFFFISKIDWTKTVNLWGDNSNKDININSTFQ
jgi:hypothetical protein